MYIETLLQDALDTMEILCMLVYDRVAAERKKHCGISALTDCVARKPQ